MEKICFMNLRMNIILWLFFLNNYLEDGVLENLFLENIKSFLIEIEKYLEFILIFLKDLILIHL